MGVFFCQMCLARHALPSVSDASAEFDPSSIPRIFTDASSASGGGSLEEQANAAHRRTPSPSHARSVSPEEIYENYRAIEDPMERRACVLRRSCVLHPVKHVSCVEHVSCIQAERSAASLWGGDAPLFSAEAQGAATGQPQSSQHGGGQDAVGGAGSPTSDAREGGGALIKGGGAHLPEDHACTKTANTKKTVVLKAANADFEV
ncbi:hypothetical protein T484DRAFT_2020283 [Baffinella frigidus]|nr:hypothetical protein T484DRAFT_2020283 [Cryptophyta sp. CCMP2293]